MVGFVLWEKLGARHPLIPFHLLKNRTVVAGFIIAIVHPCASGIASYVVSSLSIETFLTIFVLQQLLLHFPFVIPLQRFPSTVLMRLSQCPSPPTNLSNRQLEFLVSTSSPVFSLVPLPVSSFGQ